MGHACASDLPFFMGVREPEGMVRMWDLFYLAVVLVFFGAAAAYVRGCERL